MTDFIEDLLRLGDQIEQYEASQNESNKIRSFISPSDNNDAIFVTNVQLLLFVLFSLTFILALFGNIMVIAVQLYCFNSQPFQNIKKYLISLAVSDITIGVLCVPFIFSDLVLNKWIFPRWICPSVQFGQLLSVFVTSNTLMIIGIERYSAVHRPFSKFYDKLIAKSNFIIALVWSTGCLYAFAPVQHAILHVQANSANNQTFYQCDSFARLSQTNRRFFVITNFVLTFLIPTVVLIFTYSSIMSKMTGQNNIFYFHNHHHHHSSTSTLQSLSTSSVHLRPVLVKTVAVKCSIRHSRNRSKVIRLTLSIIILHLLCGTPIKVFQLLHEYRLIQYTTTEQSQRQLLVYIICHWIAMANSALNPIVYTFTSERFRNDLRRLAKLFRN